MKSIFSRSLLLLMAAVLAGCMHSHSPTPRLYLLHAERGEANIFAEHHSGKGVIVLRPLVLAEYLNRPQIVLRKGEREVAHAEFDRWAEPLKIQTHNYLAAALANALPEYNIIHSARGAKTRPLFEIGVAILMLDGAPKESVRLRANWQIFSVTEELRIVAEGKSDLSAACPESGIPGMVAATEAVLKQLSQKIANALTHHQAEGTGSSSPR